MDITWFGHSCFRLRDRAVSVVTDPYGKDMGLILPRVRADLVTVSHDADDHNYAKGVKSGFKTLTGPGEYEVSGVFVTGLELRGERKKGKEPDKLRNTVFLFEFEDLTDLPPGRSRSRSIAGAGGRNAWAKWTCCSSRWAAANRSTPRRLPKSSACWSRTSSSPCTTKSKARPLKLDPVTKFLKEMGLDNVPTQETLKVSHSSLPEETQIVLLELKSKEE